MQTVTKSSSGLGALGHLWKATYTITQAFTWAILPIAQIYHDAGDFTYTARLKTAIRENLVLGGILCCVGLLITAIVVSKNQNVTPASVGPTLVALSNTFGITCEIFLLGFGLVEIPSIFFRRASTHASSRKLSNSVGHASIEMERAYADLLRLLAVYRQLRYEVPRRHKHRSALEVIRSDIERAAPFELDEKALEHEQEAIRDEMDYDYEELSDLVVLRRRLKRTMDAYRRCRSHYEHSVYNTIESEDVSRNRRAAGTHEFISSLRSNKGPSWKRMVEWYAIGMDLLIAS